MGLAQRNKRGEKDLVALCAEIEVYPKDQRLTVTTTNDQPKQKKKINLLG